MTTQIAKEYAQALFALGEESDSTRALGDALQEAWAVLQQHPDYMELLASPAIQKDERDRMVAEAFAAYPEYAVSFLQLLCRRGRIRSLNDCIAECRLLYQTAVALSTAQVVSAVPLTEAEKQQLAEKLSARTGRTVTLECEVDESLLGGMVVHVDGKVLDGSLRRRLHAVKDVMKQ